MTTHFVQKIGTRMTKQRQVIWQVLTESPQSVTQITSVLRKSEMILAVTTVYRTLRLLEEQGLVRVTQFGNGVRLFEKESATVGHHHHHVVCEQCGKVTDIILAEEPMLQAVARQSQFQVNSHHVEFFGVCAQCQ